MLETLCATDHTPPAGLPLETPTTAEVDSLAQFLFSVNRRRAQLRIGRLADESWSTQMAYREIALAALYQVAQQAPQP